MITTPNLGLKVWNLTTDPYDHGQLADNWSRVDNHDHSPGKGKQIPTAGIADGAITAVKIAPGATTPGDSSITTGKLADGAVTTPKLADGALSYIKTGTGADGLSVGSFNAYLSATPAAATGTRKVVCNTERFDLSGWFDATNARYTPQVAGYYILGGLVQINGGMAAGNVMSSVIYKNGSAFMRIGEGQVAGTSYGIGVNGFVLVHANGSTDYFELWVSTTASASLYGSSTDPACYFQGCFVGRA